MSKVAMRYFHFDDEEYVYVSSGSMRKVAMASIWLRYLVLIVCFISQEKWASRGK